MEGTVLLILICVIVYVYKRNNPNNSTKKSDKKYSREDLELLNFNENCDFRHKESFREEGEFSTYFEWNLECIELVCNISYLDGKRSYIKQIVLKDYEQKNQIIKQIIKGMKKSDEDIGTHDCFPESKIIIYGKKEYHTFDSSVKNEEFYQVLNNLIGKNYERILENERILEKF